MAEAARRLSAGSGSGKPTAGSTPPLEPRWCEWPRRTAAQPARAESLRCNGSAAAEGDSRISVLYKCGQPLLKDSFCAPLTHLAGVRRSARMPGGVVLRT